MKSAEESAFLDEPQPTADRIKSETLLRGRSVVVIVHGDQEYRLRLTKSGKLILTK